MTPAVHSIWLMPSAADEGFLAAHIRELSGRFGTPIFTPHLTIRGDSQAPASELAVEIAAVARRQQPFFHTVAAIETSESYFRSFYARFSPHAPLIDLKRRLDPAGADAFLPHISLLYGPVEAARKAAAATERSQALVGRRVLFDRLCVVRSGQNIPIDEWATVTSVALG